MSKDAYDFYAIIKNIGKSGASTGDREEDFNEGDFEIYNFDQNQFVDGWMKGTECLLPTREMAETFSSELGGEEVVRVEVTCSEDSYMTMDFILDEVPDDEDDEELVNEYDIEDHDDHEEGIDEAELAEKAFEESERE